MCGAAVLLLLQRPSPLCMASGCDATYTNASRGEIQVVQRIVALCSEQASKPTAAAAAAAMRSSILPEPQASEPQTCEEPTAEQQQSSQQSACASNSDDEIHCWDLRVVPIGLIGGWDGSGGREELHSCECDFDAKQRATNEPSNREETRRRKLAARTASY